MGVVASRNEVESQCAIRNHFTSVWGLVRTKVSMKNVLFQLVVHLDRIRQTKD